MAANHPQKKPPMAANHPQKKAAGGGFLRK